MNDLLIFISYYSFINSIDINYVIKNADNISGLICDGIVFVSNRLTFYNYSRVNRSVYYNSLYTEYLKWKLINE